MSAWSHRHGDRRRVVVVGAGVAGMTAAHELVERGYEVEVVEMAPDSYDPTRPRLGGMARTSWARVPSPAVQAPLRITASELARATPRDVPAGSLVRIESDVAPLPIVATLAEALEERGAVAAFVEALRPDDQLLVIASRVLSRIENRQLGLALGRPFQLTVAEGDPRAESDSRARGDSPAGGDSPAQGGGAATGYRDITGGASDPIGPSSAIPPTEAPRVQISVVGARVPGEHGFRFFPSFYHHLFDTMKRIPIAEAPTESTVDAVVPGVPLVADSSRSVFDALVSNEVIQLGLQPRGGRARSFEIPRRPMRSPEDLRALFGDALERAGYHGQDLHRLITRYVEYLTSAPERRRGYEDISWSTFLGLAPCAYSEGFARHVQSGAQALVAMSSQHNDARTIGSIAMQLTLDQVRANPGGYTDATLRGPTSVELFEPWRAYLESESVTFTRGQLVGFHGRGLAVRPVFARPHDERRPEAGLDVVPIDPADYYVIAIPVDRFQALFDGDGTPRVQWHDLAAPELLDRRSVCVANQQCLELDGLERGYPPDPPGERSDDIAKLLAFDTGDVAREPDAGPMRNMCGIQFYFECDVRVSLGHTLCLDSAWGVSYISQSRYWQDRSRGQSGIRGVISAIFTMFDADATDRRGEHPKRAKDCTPDEIADRVWAQIRDGWDRARFGPLPDPDYYYIDESLQYDGRGWRNATPYLVNHVGAWPLRGGLRLDTGDYAYRMQLGHTVFAGAFMRTYTRLNTMEAANESGRRATNAILAYDRDHDRAPLQSAQIWNLEDHELPEVGVLRDLDRRIARRGGHHILRHAGIEAALRAVPWDLVRLFLPTGEDPR